MAIEIIAEIGVNHNGDVDTAHDLIAAAKDAGCDTVKFQYFTAVDRYPELQLGLYNLLSLKNIAEKNGLRFLCTPDTLKEAEALRDILKVDRIKIGSSNATNLPMLREIAEWGLPIVLSTGACNKTDVLAAARIVTHFKSKPAVIMHCVSAYPAPHDAMNFGVFNDPHIGHYYNGFSDHTDGNCAAIMAVALGARVIEKHLTLNIHDKGPDHSASIEPHEMRGYVATLRTVDRMMGTGFKCVMPCEELNRKAYEEFVEAQYADSPAA